ncbi:RagB/SusD family nutrient uptake outer membrane protein [Sphingobacterium yanglingense]|uniref:SusD-like starch-binding protein associating with outer membrane n=1 Tax=Sphingobacterium yanglingense TaxID=1437280 RepID=A0A4R6W8Y7_9SPHI|nr:RagB/SusD family nutrient uptake outer membrane protein [Sphingobacterium yanglingense]TDQ73529.1 SusD-like starch-binding protein associating with outer membrane [Sphingobacterium yanglingense]
MKKIYFALLFAGALYNTSCNKYLDVKPVGQLIPSKVEDLENLLNNPRSIDYHFIDNNRGSFYAYLGDNTRISENEAKYQYVNTHPNIDRYAAYTFYHPYTDPNKPQTTWEWGIYRATAMFNTVIDETKALNAENSDLGKLITAQAKAGRAWSYMVAALGYGPMYDPAGANDQKVLPYRKDSSPIVANPGLSTTKEILDLVEKDLLEAKDAPANVGNPTRASLTAVDALLAQLYMFKRDWAKMGEYADAAWAKALATKGNVDNLIYDFNKFSYKPDPNASPSPGTDVEVGLELIGQDNLINQTDNREFLFYRAAAASAWFYPSEEFLNLFDKANDQRYRLFALKDLGYAVTVGGVKHDDGVQTYYYRDDKMAGNQGLTYPELLLMKAEANARLNKLSNALTDLNLLRKYRYSTALANLPNGAALSQDQLLEEILKERRRELPSGTFQRVFDIKRLALDTGKPWAKQKIEHTIGSKTYSADVKSKYFTLQINNPTIQLNPSWGLTPNMETYLPVK